MNRKNLLAQLTLYALLASNATANCIALNENERLSNFCLTESIKGKLVDKNSAAIVVNKLKREGYFGGLRKSDWSTRIYPTFDYSNNINGGNPNKKLVLGELVFEGESDLARKEGVVATLNFRASNRSTRNSGKYIQTNILGAYSFSPKHKNGFSNIGLDTCFKNKLTARTFFDICASVHSQKKEIVESNMKSLSLAWSKLTFANNVGFSEGKFKFNRLFTNEYNQNQISVSLDTIHKQQFYTSLELTKGEPVENQMALNYGLNVSISRLFQKRKYSVSMSQRYIDGGMMLGFDRSDVESMISFNSMINPKTKISIGYTSNNSTINYYDQNYPAINLVYIW